MPLQISQAIRNWLDPGQAFPTLSDPLQSVYSMCIGDLQNQDQGNHIYQLHLKKSCI